MRSIARLFSAFGTLADSILSLASVVDTATAKVRMQLANETDPPALAHNGEVIDGSTGPGGPVGGNGAAKRGKARAGV